MNNCRAKVADFGFAKLAPTDASHISTQVKGTAGYLDPEYLRTYQLNEKSDVYSFGVLLVELVTGRRPIEPKRSIIERVTTKWVSFCRSRHHTCYFHYHWFPLPDEIETESCSNMSTKIVYIWS